MRAVIAGICAAALCACGAVSGGGAVPSPTPPTTPTAGFDVLVTQNDAAVSVHVGQRIEVVLVQRSGMTRWGDVRADDETVLEAVPTGISAPSGQTYAGFQALKAGEATITSYATALCSPGQACPMFAMLFSVRVTVT